MRKAIALTILLLITISYVYALEVYIRPPRMVARINLTETSEWNGFIEVKNNNNDTVNVTFTPTGNITDKIIIIDQVKLKPGELRQENFTLKINNPGTYQGGIIVTYSKEGEVPVALQADIIAIVTGQTQQKQTSYIYLVILPLVFAIGLIILLRWRK